MAPGTRHTFTPPTASEGRLGEHSHFPRDLVWQPGIQTQLPPPPVSKVGLQCSLLPGETEVAVKAELSLLPGSHSQLVHGSLLQPSAAWGKPPVAMHVTGPAGLRQATFLIPGFPFPGKHLVHEAGAPRPSAKQDPRAVLGLRPAQLLFGPLLYMALPP